jgi:TadE-like protein
MLHSFFYDDTATITVTRASRTAAGQRAYGQAMVEMAIVIGVLLLVILGGLDVLQIQMTQYTVSQAVRAAAHQAALIGGPDGQNGSWGDGARPSGTVADTARVILDSGMVTNSSKATITVSCARTPCRRYDPITVRITYQDAIWAPIGPFRLAKADLSATRLAEKDAQ